MKPSIIAVDFDGTCVDHRFPEVGPDLPDAVFVLKDLVAHDHKLILWTMRGGDPLRDAAYWFENKGIPLFGVNANPTQGSWTSSPKAYAQFYIDDAAVGAPLMQLAWMKRPGVDWKAVHRILKVQP
jgi:hydroxymethylpyrimidine pyrophosphatase-like HAD family hydrolase